MGVWGTGGSKFQGYDYVQTAQPGDPKEGETWYDVDGDAAFVYDGASWVQMTVTDHAQLSGVTAGAHRTDSNIVSTVDGQVDADTVDGYHASSLQTPNSTQSGGAGTVTTGDRRALEVGYYVTQVKYYVDTGASGMTFSVNCLNKSPSNTTSS
ncbi:MAG: hypothetical protein ABEJ85_04990, partial [Haloarculaceae archaeon]